MPFIGFRIEQAKGLFFDRQKVQSAVNRAERREYHADAEPTK